MTIGDMTLGELRQKIDRLDEQMHDLVLERAAIVAEIGRHKDAGGAMVIHPEREAAILRRLAARHRSRLPFGAIARIWREIIAASIQLQQPLAIAVYAPEELPDAWDLARDHYGSQAPMIAYRSIGQVIRAVTDRSAAIGVLPWPSKDDRDPWWRQLLSRDPMAPRVIARLPFAGRGNARGTTEALALARQGSEGDAADRALLVVEFPSHTSRARVIACFGEAGLEAQLLGFTESNGISLALAEIAGPLAPTDPRLEELSARLGTQPGSLYHLGGYAASLSILAGDTQSLALPA